MNARLNPPTYELHPLCVLFPRMVGTEFDALCDDIEANGLRTPIVLHEGMILDGGNRYRACLEAGVEPQFVEFAGGNLATFVLSVNLHRRHLSPGQQAAIVASAQDWSTAQVRGGDRKSDQSATLHLDSVASRAAESGASLRTQKMADKVAKADPALAVQVGHGEVSLPQAHAMVSEPAKPKKPKPPASESEAPAAPIADDPRDAQIKALTAQSEDLEKALKEELAENTRIGAVLDADDRVAEAMAVNKELVAENKRLKAQIGQLTERINGLVGESTQQVRRIKAMQAKMKKAGLE